MSRLILVEGIPGSGKSTMAKKIREYYIQKGINTVLYSEGDAHPADMAWNACVPREEYKRLLEDNPQYAEVIQKNTQLEEEFAVVAYTKLGFYPRENVLMEYFENHEVYDGRVPLDVFSRLHLARWRGFAERADESSVYIFECAYLQNHINELMGIYDKGIDFIAEYMQHLIKTVESLEPRLIYLSQESTYETIDRVARERVSPDKSKMKDWIDIVAEYVENSPYGKNHGLRGFDGVVEFFENRKKLELEVIDKLPIDCTVIDNHGFDWDRAYKDVLESLES